MPAAAARMPLRSSQDAPRFLGTADDLPHYIAEVEELCKSRQKSSDPELIKWAVYSVDGDLWDSFVLTRDALADPASWEDFKCTLHEVFLQHEVASRSASLAASLLPLPVPFAPPPSLLPAMPVTPSLPQLPVPALMMSQAVLEVLLSPLLLTPPADSATPLLPAPAAPQSLVRACPLHVPAAAPRLSPASSDCLLLAEPPQLVFAAPSLPPNEVLPSPTPSPVGPLPVLAIADSPPPGSPLLLPAESASPPMLVPPVPQPALIMSALLPAALLPCAPPAAVAVLIPLQPHPPVPLIPSVVPVARPLPPPAHDPLLAVLPAPDDAPPTPDDKAFCWTRGGPAPTPAVTCIVTILCTTPPVADVPPLLPATPGLLPAPVPQLSPAPTIRERPTADVPSLRPASSPLSPLPAQPPLI
ncbi:hypothetical protein AX14_005697 [Amanita brunnescens Koide BX004]|nr:hypothetical protein AX14_005697 [Amanita brunnescens Koide BX004]